MYEDAGRANRQTYVRQVNDLLRTGGLFLNHGVVTVERLREHYALTLHR